MTTPPSDPVVPTDPDPQLAAALAEARAAVGAEAKDADAQTPVPVLRARYRRERAFWNADPPAIARRCETVVAGPGGDLALRLYHPVPQVSLPVIVYFHGGGWIVGSLDTHDGIMRRLALDARMAVVGVDYRLAPEAKFPAQIDDGLAALDALPDLAADWRIAPERLFLAGDSAGAQLALACTLGLERAARSNVRGLALFYGAYGLRDSRSRRMFDGGVYGMTRGDLDFYYAMLAPDAEALADPRIDLLAADLSTLPPVFLGAAALDPLLDDTLALADRLTGVGGQVALTVYDGMLHGFLHYARLVDRARAALSDAAQWMRRRAEADRRSP